MAQASIISRADKLPSAELNLGGTSTSEKVFLQNGSTTAALFCPLPVPDLVATNLKQCAVFDVLVAGRVTGGSSAVTFTPKLYFGTSTTAASDTVLESAAAVTVTAVSGGWFIRGTLIIDYTSGKIDGGTWCFGNGTTSVLTALTKIENVPSASSTAVLTVNSPTTQQGFVVSGTFGTNGQAANVAYVDIFQVEMIG